MRKFLLIFLFVITSFCFFHRLEATTSSDYGEIGFEHVSCKDKVYLNVEDAFVDEQAGVLVYNGIDIPFSEIGLDEEGVYLSFIEKGRGAFIDPYYICKAEHPQCSQCRRCIKAGCKQDPCKCR